MIRHWVARLLAASAAAALLAGGAHAGTAPDGTTEDLATMHQGVARHSILYLPRTAKPGPRPLVIALHGMGNTGAHFRRWSHFDQAAERHGFVVVYPDAIGRRWNYDRLVVGPTPRIGAAAVDDVGFVKALIDDLVAQKVADPRRIYIAGMSRGGMMAIRLACDMSERLAGIAVVAGLMTASQRKGCRPERPVPLLMISGTADHGMPFDGNKPNSKDFLSALSTMRFWSDLHGCRGHRRSMLPHRNPDDPTYVTLLVVSDCRSGDTLRFYGIHGGGHRFPVLDSGDVHKGQEALGPLNRDIESAEEILAFFERTRPTFGYSQHD